MLGPEFEEALRSARAGVDDTALGLYGPESITWRISRESIVFLCAGRAALLQLAHPYVAHAVDQHSETRSDPIRRFNRTFLQVYKIIFGDADTAIAAARRIHRVHDTIHGAIDEDVGRFPRGHRYHAHDPGALLWVWATLLESSVIAYEIGVGPLSAAEKDKSHEEMKLYARLFGVPEDILPADWRAFEGYCARMAASDELAVGRLAREMARFLLTAKNRWARPLMGWYSTMTAGLLPPRIRQEYELPFGHAEELIYERSLRALSRAWPWLPARLRYVPAYFEALYRLGGKPRPDRIGRAFERTILRAVRPG